MVDDLIQKVSNGDVVVLRSGAEGPSPLFAGGFYAPATITLIKRFFRREPKNRGLYTLVDTGGVGESEKVRELLQSQGISPGLISQVLVTHTHPDHFGNPGMFEHANIITPDSIFERLFPNHFRLMLSGFYQKPGEEYNGCLLDKKTRLISTPGHSGWDFSVIYGGLGGTVAMVGDLFWSQKDFEEDSEFRELCVNPVMQMRSREYVRKHLRPDVIVPGHGPAFKPQY